MNAADYPRPQGVRVVRANGDEIPVELGWGGLDEQGDPLWIISTPVDLDHGDRIVADMIPPQTGIVFGRRGNP